MNSRVGNSLIGFLSESFVFSEIMRNWAISSNQRAFGSFAQFWWATWGIRSFAQFWWATWANRSWWLIFGERPEWFTHGRSFVVSDLSDSLTSLVFLTNKKVQKYDFSKKNVKRIARFCERKSNLSEFPTLMNSPQQWLKLFFLV